MADADRFGSARRREVIEHLGLLEVLADEQALAVRFQPSEKLLVVATDFLSPVGILLAEGVAGLMHGQVRLDIEEKYHYEKSQGAPLLVSYSYTISYMHEVMIDPKYLPRNAQGSWGELLLTQRKYFRFDGPEADWEGKDLAYRNRHPRHHVHAFTEEYLRVPATTAPSLLSVGAFGVLHFDHDRWLAAARKHARVLEETKRLMPHVATI